MHLATTYKMYAVRSTDVKAGFTPVDLNTFRDTLEGAKYYTFSALDFFSFVLSFI